ncbi:Atg22p [Ascoidea rubescens DSM 1968]|uniref:Autophagy-related protein n=1 Tax=Ascoidea rubescens DSM 1968 TaxID=1344418 RepID=A0A1D2VBJ7_9ASCO|nr:MFS general substrate transporter [Ascoidea rubescens DSM 1968]ODV59064.1 MFS general substrate transporter [Ascoidea rubescens DSM 1968]
MTTTSRFNPNEHTPLLQEEFPNFIPIESRISEDDSDETDTSIDLDSTTINEILGWCLYGWAAEPFIISAIATYIPLLLEQFARDNGVLFDDHLVPCVSSNDPNDEIPNPNLPPNNVNNLAFNIFKAKQCVVKVLGFYVDTSSFTMYTFAFSVFVQTLLVISITGFADRGNYKKPVLVISGFLGAISTILMYFLNYKFLLLSAFYCVLSNSCFGVVNVCGNSILPVLVSNSYKIRKLNKKLVQSSELSLNDQIKIEGKLTIQKGLISSKISGLGSGLGYFAAFIVQLISILIVLKTGSSTLSIQYALLFIGCWWFIFQFPIIFLLKSREIDPDLIPLTNNNRKITFFEYIQIGWLNLLTAFKKIKLLKDVCIFLTGWFIISDSITTINSAAILFSKTELSMTTPELAIIGVIAIIAAIFGTLIIPNFVQPYFKLNSKMTLILIIIWSSMIPFYGILGFYFDNIGLQHKSEMYLLAMWYGISLGGLSTISRSLFSLLIPRGRESLFFALFAVTDKGSSIIGPIISGLITDKTHNIRYCFWFLWILLVISLPVFWLLNLERGKRDASEFEDEELLHEELADGAFRVTHYQQ